MSTKLPAFQFYPGDWLKDTRHLSPAAKGAWIDIMVSMWDAQIRGVLCLTTVGYARLIGSTADQAADLILELTDPPVCDRRDLPDGRIELTCRRMVKDEEDRVQDRTRQQRHRQRASESRDCHGDVTDTSHPSSSSSSTSVSNAHSSPKEKNAGGETATPGEAASTPPSPAPPWVSDTIVLRFPVDGNPNVWHLRQSMVERLKLRFPSLDILAECNQCLAWLEANPTRRNTASGMPARITKWLTKSTNTPSMRAKPNAAAVDPIRPPATSRADRRAAELEEALK